MQQLYLTLVQAKLQCSNLKSNLSLLNNDVETRALAAALTRYETYLLRQLENLEKNNATY